METIDEGKLWYTEYLRQENSMQHRRYSDEMFPYHLLKEGDVQGVAEALDTVTVGTEGTLSNDPLRNAQYLFVAATTVACRFAIEGGVEQERSYDISDLFIRRADTAASPEAVSALRREMMLFYAREVAAARRKQIYSRPVLQATDYICSHLHQKQTVEEIAEAVGLSPNYLSSLFRKELGMTVSRYLLGKRMDAARNMLRHSGLAYDEIASILAFSSQSHFIQVFKRETGMTPREYRNRIDPEEIQFRGEQPE